jgi:multisubunit Na+/H+ antiporter MnhG subunit
MTSPTGAHAIARAAHRSGVPLAAGSVLDRYQEDGEAREGKEDPGRGGGAP